MYIGKYLNQLWNTERGACSGAIGLGIAVQAGSSLFRFPVVSLGFFRPLYSPGFDSASNRNDYQEYLVVVWWGKGGRCIGLTSLQPTYDNCLEIWGLKLLETSGLVQAYTGIVLPLQEEGNVPEIQF